MSGMSMTDPTEGAWRREGIVEDTEIVAPDGEQFSLMDTDEVDGLCGLLNELQSDHGAAAKLADVEAECYILFSYLRGATERAVQAEAKLAEIARYCTHHSVEWDKFYAAETILAQLAHIKALATINGTDEAGR
jgi:hypothetical protein